MQPQNAFICIRITAFIVGIGVLLPGVHAQVPSLISYQGRLVDNGKLVNGDVDLSLRLYEVQTGGSPLYDDSATVPVVDGLYSTFIGDDTRLGSLSAALTNAEVWLEVSVNDKVQEPRQRLVSAAYAMIAGGVTNQGISRAMIQPAAVDGDRIEDKTILFTHMAQNGAGNGQVMKFNESGWWEPADDETSAAADHGALYGLADDDHAQYLLADGKRALAGDLDAGGFTIQNLRAGTARYDAVRNDQAVKVDDNAGGALAGTYPDPSLAANAVDSDAIKDGGIGFADMGQNGAGGGQVMKWNGSAWAAADDTGTVLVGYDENGSFSPAPQALGDDAIAQGRDNIVRGHYGVIAGGYYNRIGNGSSYGLIGGGFGNDIETTTGSVCVTIGGGEHNDVGDGSHYATLAGGQENRIPNDTAAATIGGGSYNTNRAQYATIDGGRNNAVGKDALYAAVGGGHGNTIEESAKHGVIGGGKDNGISLSSDAGTICGGCGNNISSNCYNAVIGGGGRNTVSYYTQYAVIGGGTENQIDTAADYVTLGGGRENSVGLRSDNATVGGGVNNHIGAQSISATVAGGDGNRIGTNSAFSAIGGGHANRIGPNARYATIPGGSGGKAEHPGTFVWADDSNYYFSSTATNEFSARCTGGARFVSGVDGTGSPNAGVRLAAGGNSWSSVSDRNLKENVRELDPTEVLDTLSRVPITEWNMKAQDPSIRHVGPMAQDFHAAFGLGESDRHISSSDADGIALAAIQGVYQLVREIQTENRQLREEIEALKSDR